MSNTALSEDGRSEGSQLELSGHTRMTGEVSSRVEGQV